MKNVFVILGILFYLPCLSQTFNLKVAVTNIKETKGKIDMGVFNSAESFLEKGYEFKTESKIIDSDSIVITLQNLEPGDYAISLFHDINSDNVCNLNLFGIPTEPYGFSNNFKPKLSKPTFADCMFSLTQDSLIQIKLTSW